jgi:hypothetical protein
MKVNNEKVRAGLELARVHDAFEEFRRHGNGRGSGYPLELKRLAVQALDVGHTPSEVATAAQISAPSICNWRRAPSCRPPKQLKLVEDPVLQIGTKETASVLFQSGLRIEIPVLALTADLIKTLNGVAL